MISSTGFFSQPIIHITSINLWALKNKYLGVCFGVERNFKEVSVGMLITLLYIPRVTPSFSKSLFKLLGAEDQCRPHCTIHGTSMS